MSPVVDPEAGMVPCHAMDAVRRVLEDGHRKYADLDDGRQVDTRTKRHHLRKAMSHLAEYMSGERRDEDSGENPLAHVITRLMLVLERDERGLP